MKMVLGILFLSFSNVDFQFNIEEFTWRFYIAAQVLIITSWVQLIDKKEFVLVALNKNSETFIVHITALEELAEMTIHLLQALQVASL